MALSAYARAMLDEFGGPPTPPDTLILNLPDHQGFVFGPLTDDDLHDATDAQYNFEIPNINHLNSEFLKQTYTRVTHPDLDLNVYEDDMVQAWRHCHNGLWKVREQQWLDDEHIHHLAERLITWSQDQQPTARLGDRSSGNWWIVPDAYHLRLAGDEESPPLGHFLEEADPVGYMKLHETFDKAKFTVHMVHHVNHWAVLIYQNSNGNTFYIDSMPALVQDRSRLARDAFKDWLKASQKQIRKGAKHHTVKVPDQQDRWSCGLHAVVNAMAFLRYESLGWKRIEGWTTTESRPMRRQLITCLHQLMGLKYVPGDSPTTSRARGYRKPKQKKQPATKESAAKESPKKPSPKASAKGSPGKAATKQATTKATCQTKNTSPPPFGIRGAPLGRELVNETRAEAQKAALATAKRLAAFLKRQQQESTEKAARQALRKQESEKRAARQAARAKQRDAWAADSAKVGTKPVAGRRGAISHEALPTATDLQQQKQQQQADDATSGSSRKKRKIDSAPGLLDSTPVPSKRSKPSRKSDSTTTPTTTPTTTATPATKPPAKPKSPSTATSPATTTKPTKTPPSSPTSKRRSARPEPSPTTATAPTSAPTPTTPAPPAPPAPPARATKPTSAPTQSTTVARSPVGSRERLSGGSLKRKATATATAEGEAPTQSTTAARSPVGSRERLSGSLKRKATATAATTEAGDGGGEGEMVAARKRRRSDQGGRGGEGVGGGSRKRAGSF